MPFPPGNLQFTAPDAFSGSLTDLGGLVDMFDTMMEKSRTSSTDPRDCTSGSTSADLDPGVEARLHDPGGYTTSGTATATSDAVLLPSCGGGPGLTLLLDRPLLATVDEVSATDSGVNTISSTSTSSISGCDSLSGYYLKRRLALEQRRPLSISSTSSSSSSSTTNSLPRGIAWGIHPPGSDEDGVNVGVRKSNSSGSADSGLSSPTSYLTSTGSLAAPAPSPPPLCSPLTGDSLGYSDRVVAELVQTEAIYVHDLQQVVEGYLFYWRENPVPALTDEYMDALFGQLQDIIKCNSGFLSALEDVGLDVGGVADCFVKYAGRFSVYIDYCTNYPRTVCVLTELMRREQTARLFRERQAALCHALPLGSFLLKPVQRILKYRLLLQNMKTHLDAVTSMSFGAVSTALDTMSGLAAHINEMKRRHEHAVRVQEIQSLLYDWPGDDLTTYGELIAEGAFRVPRAKSARHAFLFDSMLLVTKRREDATLAYKSHILCSNLMLIESVPGEPYTFHVVPFDNPKQQTTLQARTLDQKREWTLQLKRSILQSYKTEIPCHARELVMQLGQHADKVRHVRRRSKAPHSAPEYLERRRAAHHRRYRHTGDTDDAADGQLNSAARATPRRKLSAASCSDKKGMKRGLLSLRRHSEPFFARLTSASALSATGLDRSAASSIGGHSVSSDLHRLPEEMAGGAASFPPADAAVQPDQDSDDDDGKELETECSTPAEDGDIVRRLVLQNEDIRRALARSPRRSSSCKSRESADVEKTECDVEQELVVQERAVDVNSCCSSSALAVASVGDTEYVSFMDYDLKLSCLTSPRFDTPPPPPSSGGVSGAASGDPRRRSLVADPCRKVARRLQAGHTELAHLLGSLRRRSVRRPQLGDASDNLSAISAGMRRSASSPSQTSSASSQQQFPCSPSCPTLTEEESADSMPCEQPTGDLTSRALPTGDLTPRLLVSGDSTPRTLPIGDSSASDVHPSHRIYGTAVSQSALRQLVRSFRGRLAARRSVDHSVSVQQPASSGPAVWRLVTADGLDSVSESGAIGRADLLLRSPLLTAARPSSLASSVSTVSCDVLPLGGSTGDEEEDYDDDGDVEDYLSGSEEDGEGPRESVGSFYEQELDILEDLNDADMVRDSAVYSEPEEEFLDSLDSFSPPVDDPPTTVISPAAEDAVVDQASDQKSSCKVAPPVASKPTTSVRQRLITLQEPTSTDSGAATGEVAKLASSITPVKSIEQRRRELERWRRGSSSIAGQSRDVPFAQGWVLRVVGRLQTEEDSCDASAAASPASTQQ